MNIMLTEVRSKLVPAMLFALLVGISAAAQAKPEQLAQQSADAWLALVDSGKYADSWQEASSMFKAHVTKDQWRSMIAAVRDPFGKVLTRKLKSAKYATSLPGAPDGQYVVIQYESSFEHKQSAIETITPMLDGDGKWRVSGYYIK